MGSLLVFAVVVAIVFTWVRATRKMRERWLRQLNLVGVWDLDAEGALASIEFTGTLASGDFKARSDGGVEVGQWRITGNKIVLSSSAGENEFDLRYFDVGKIGIDGPGRERQVYRKRADNVVPLRVVKDP